MYYTKTFSRGHLSIFKKHNLRKKIKSIQQPKYKLLYLGLHDHQEISTLVHQKCETFLLSPGPLHYLLSLDLHILQWVFPPQLAIEFIQTLQNCHLERGWNLLNTCTIVGKIEVCTLICEDFFPYPKHTHARMHVHTHTQILKFWICSKTTYKTERVHMLYALVQQQHASDYCYDSRHYREKTPEM